jgi:hypothetical protein
MQLASWKECKPITVALRTIYRAETPRLLPAALKAFDRHLWGRISSHRSGSVP